MVTVVTGASGHVGANLTRALLAAGRTVRAVGRHPSASLAGLPLEWLRADVRDPDSLRSAFDGADVVYHLAARISVTGDRDGQVWATNVEGVRNVAQAALEGGVRRFIHCSSVHAFDLERAGDRLDEGGPRAVGAHLPAYDRSKAAGEKELRRVMARGLDAVVVNPTGVIGPCDFGPSRMGAVFTALWKRRLPALVEGGFDWVDVRDVASALVAAEDRGRSGDNYLVPGHWHSLRELARMAEEVSGVPAPRVTVWMAVARAWGPIGDRLARRTDNPLFATSESLHALRHAPRVSGRKAERELGHRPRPIGESVRDLHEWCRQTGRLRPR